MKHSRQWFRNRLGKIIYRERSKYCDCPMCQNPKVHVCTQKDFETNGVHLPKYFHADYLWDMQNDCDIEYTDKIIK